MAFPDPPKALRSPAHTSWSYNPGQVAEEKGPPTVNTTTPVTCGNKDTSASALISEGQNLGVLGLSVSNHFHLIP